MAITNSYCTLADLKASLRITDTVDDTILESAIESASDMISGYAGRTFLPVGSATRVFAPQDEYITLIDDVVSVSSVKISSDADGVFDITLAGSDYELNPLNGFVDGLSGWPYTSLRAIGNYVFPAVAGRATVQVTGSWGWAAVPRPIKQATILQASRIFKRADSPLGVLSSPDLGFIRVGSKVDPDVAQLVEPYRLTRFYA